MSILTSVLSSTSNILLLGHPIRTALGFVLGISIKITLKLVSYTTNLNIDIPGIADWEFGILGVAILHIPTIKYYIFKGGSIFSEDEEKIFLAIRNMNISDYDKQILYTKLIEKYIDRIEVKAKTLDEIERPRRYPRTE